LAAVATGLSEAPAPRWGASMAFDPVHGTAVLYGGHGLYGALDDTWTWDGTRWEQQHPSVWPPARSAAQLGYDPASGRLILVGGTTATPVTDPCTRAAAGAPISCTAPQYFRGSLLVDVWSWDGRTWTQEHPPSAPKVAEGGPPMVTDTTMGALMTVGGGLLLTSGPEVKAAPVGPQADTALWRWVHHAWQEVPATSAPPGAPSNSTVAADDPGDHGVLLVESTAEPGAVFIPGGPPPKSVTSTWLWRAGSWQRQHPAQQPALRSSALTVSPNLYMATDPATKHPMIVDAARAMWRWDGTTWLRISAAPVSLAAGGAIASDAGRRAVIVFGGQTQTALSNTTWLWDGTRWRQFDAPAATVSPPPPQR
jgi:hypothetical protein